MRPVVLDTNVWISALIFPGVCRHLVTALERDRFEAALSPALLEELIRTLQKPKLKKLISAQTSDEIFGLIHQKALIVDPKVRLRVCRDPSDDAVVECAVAAKSSLIVTGDSDLLVLKRYKDILVLAPAAFAVRLKF